MGTRVSTVLTWLGLTAVIALAASMAASPRARLGTLAVGQRLLELARWAVASIQAGMQGRFGRQMAALEEVSATLDAATMQFESSLTVSKVADALSEDPVLRGRRVGVRMIGGILHLEGDVRSQQERMRAAEIAKRASGAELVANDLKVVSAAS